MAIATATAILGAAVLGAGASLAASHTAAKASEKASDQSATITRDIYNQTRADQQPFVQAGYNAVNALSGRLRLGAPPSQISAPGVTGQAPASYDAYMRANPDIAAEAQRVVASGEFPSVGAYLQYHDQKNANENRPSYADQPAGSPAGTTNGYTTSPSDPSAPVAPSVNTDDFGGGRPGTLAAGGGGSGPPMAGAPQPAPAPGNALAGSDSPGTYGLDFQGGSYTPPPAFQTPEYTAPANYQAPTFDKTYTAPTYQAPEDFHYGLGDYTASPGYQYRQDEARKGILASASATGARQSGAALKELYDRGDQIAYQDFGAERAFALGRYTDQRDTGRHNFESDRGFGYGEFRDQRGDFESDRGFGRGAYENDRNFGRSTYENGRDFNYGQSIDERNFGRASFDTDRAFNYGNALEQRDYLTGRFDRGTDDLFRVSGQGAAAASAQGQAGQNYASGMTGVLNNNAANTGNAAIAGANSMNALLGAGVNALSYNNGRAGAPAGSAGTSPTNPYLF